MLKVFQTFQLQILTCFGKLFLHVFTLGNPWFCDKSNLFNDMTSNGSIFIFTIYFVDVKLY